jgi:hypothetical protein
MRPVRPGVYGSDLAAVARVRRRIASDESQSVVWRKKLLKLCDQLHSALSDVVTSKLLDGESPKSVKRAKKKKSAAAPIGTA